MTQQPFSAQVPFGAHDFADNPEPRCPCLLLLDTSFSMNGAPIAELNAGLQGFKQELSEDSLAMKRVEVAIVTFGPVRIQNAFHSAIDFYPPILAAQGDTPMAAAIQAGLDMLQQRKTEYRANGVPFYRPWVFLITDGAPTDMWQQAADLIKQGEQAKAFAFFAVGVGGADISLLRQLSVREPLKLEGLKFRELFQWLSNSMKSVSHSTLGGEVALQSPKGWAAV